MHQKRLARLLRESRHVPHEAFFVVFGLILWVTLGCQVFQYHIAFDREVKDSWKSLLAHFLTLGKRNSGKKETLMLKIAAVLLICIK